MIYKEEVLELQFLSKSHAMYNKNKLLSEF